MSVADFILPSPDDFNPRASIQPPRKVPALSELHQGQHHDCYACKLQSLHFGGKENPTHVKNGDHWKDNPVVERIQELTGVEVNTDIPRLK